MSRPSIITVDDVKYRVDVYPPNHGGAISTHYHDEPHEDGSPGNESHHHCNAKCLRRTAMLVPVGDPAVPEDVLYLREYRESKKA